MTEFLAAIFRISLIWTCLEVVIFTSIILFAIRKNLLSSILNEDGTYKEKLSPQGRITALLMFVGVTILPVMFDVVVLGRLETPIRFSEYFIVNFWLLFVLFLWDTIIIDFFVLVKWRPRFLIVSEKLCAKSMKSHILSSIRLQLFPMVLIAFTISAVFYYI